MKTLKKDYTIEELAQMAYKGARSDFKTLLRGSEQSAYLALRYLYKLYEVGGISKEEAGKTKAQITRRYGQDRLREEQLDSTIKAFADTVKRTATANENYRREENGGNQDTALERQRVRSGLEHRLLYRRGATLQRGYGHIYRRQC